MPDTHAQLRVAIAGCHRMTDRNPGSHNFASAFDAVAETEMVAVFDRGGETRAAFVDCWGEVPAFDDFQQMLDGARPDLVCIATRQTMHADMVEAAVAAGVRGILCDKPLVTSPAELDRVLAACDHVPLLLALDRRWFPRYVELRRQLADGLIGQVTSVIAYGLPNLINHGCHWYDTLLGLAGDAEPVWVSGMVDDVSGDPPESRRRLDPPGRAQIGLEDGRVLYVTSAGRYEGDGLPLSFDIVGSTGRLLLLGDATECHVWSAGGAGDAVRQRPLELPADERPWPAGPAMVRDLVHAATTGARTACDLTAARRATEVGFAIHASSARDGARILLPLADRSLRIESYPWGNE